MYRIAASQKLTSDWRVMTPLGSILSANAKGAAIVPSKKATASRRT